VTAIARARPGGVAFHCGVGRDRAGLVSILLLALLGVAPDAIAGDYELSAANLVAHYAAAGEADQGPELEAYLRGRDTSAREVIVSMLQALDVAVHLTAAGLAEADLAALRERLLEPPR
jgi:protein tyrosine/serine phosphatase